ncbi:TetR/AcrR family transcriptional regulator [Clostridium sp. C2-6-12]|uniref:TetR/AcrR family transcriptional regulator n=1 Tax=Clostridium sp. C2-6-12 TaxID=2698832 RepID=UPI00136EEC37|nr:TetR/AcrR family transcriptional regulator [Clostridium sp. C2-6-12]
MRIKDGQKEKSIKEAVIRLILREGFHGTSISKIAKAAGVSPATVYIYYENKEVMFQDIYIEYSEEIYEYLLDKLRNVSSGKEFIETLVKEYYSYIKKNDEVFHFIDQFSSCPALISQCLEQKGTRNLINLLEKMKENKILKDFENDNLIAILFSPIKNIAINKYIDELQKIELIKEMTIIMQETLLV